jgi:hypothetical protein
MSDKKVTVKEAVVGADLRGEFGHDEVAIVKEFEGRINQLKKELNNE